MNYDNLIDERLHESVWDTRIAVKIKLSDKELTSGNPPLPLYYSLPRISYLASIFTEIWTAFQSYTMGKISDLWIECQGKPLKWHYPLGVLVDSMDIDLTKGPLLLTVRVRDMPKDQIFPYESKDSLRFYFNNSLKSADCIRYPAAKKAFNLKLEDFEKIKEIANENNPKNITDYRRIMNFKERMEKFPLKLVFSKTDFMLIKSVKVEEGKENDYTLGNCLVDCLSADVYANLKEKCNILIHGMEIEENMSFLFYYLNFNYMDTFLYITFTAK